MPQSANALESKKPPVTLKKLIYVAKKDFSSVLGTQYLSFFRGQVIDSSMAQRLLEQDCEEIEALDLDSLLQCPHCRRTFPIERG